MRRSDFEDPTVFRNHGERLLSDSHPPNVILYEQIATGDCFQVGVDRDSYRQSHWAASPSNPPGEWLRLSK